MDRPVDPLDPDKHPGTDDQGSVSREQPGMAGEPQRGGSGNALDGFSRRWFGIKLATWIIGIGCAIALLGWIQLHKTEANVRFLITEADQLEGQPGRKLALYRRALAGGYEPTAQTFETMANASLLLSPPDRVGALDLLEKAGLEAPENAEIQISLAYLYMDVENPGKALDHARIACELAPETAGAWQALTAAVKADALQETSLTRRAELLREGLNANRKRVELNPADAVPYLESIRMFADLAYSIADAEAYQLEAELLAESLEKARGQLERQIENALNARPGEPQVLRDQATLALITGDQETARKSLTQLLAKPEHSAWAATLLGWIEGNSDNLQRACELLRVAGSAGRPIPLAWIRYGQILRQMGDPQSALDFLLPLSQSPQAPPELFLEIGQLYLAAGRIGPAAELAQEMNNRFSGQGWSELLEANIALREGLFSNAVQRLQSAIGKEAGNSRNTHWLLAEAQMLAGRLQDAAQSLDRAIETWPDSTDLLASRALVALNLKRPDQAIEYGQSALRLSPGNVDAAQASVRAMIQLRRFDSAREILDRLVAIRPENPMPYLLRAEVESAAGETGQALEQLDLARPLSMSAALADQIEAQRIRLEKEAGAENWEARFRIALATDSLPQAIEIVSDAAKTFGAIRSVKAANAAVLLYQGRTNEAIRALEKLLRESPKLDPMVCIYMIQALIQKGRMNESIQLAEQAISQHPERADIREALAEAFMALGDDQMALSTLEKALDIAPGDDHVHYKLAAALRTSGKLEEAIGILQKGRSLEGPSYDLITLRLADYLTEAGRPGEALDLAMEAHRNDPENTGLAFYLAGLLWNAGETTEADAVQKRAALAQPNSLECTLRSIRYFQTTGRPRLALEQCTEGVRKFPADSEIYKYKGTLELALGQINPAVESFLKAIRFDYENAKTYLDIARQLNIVGLRKDGLEVLKLSVRALPNSLDCRLALAQQYFELGQTPEAWEQIPVAKEIESGLAENTLLLAGGFALNCLQSFEEIPLDLEKILIGLQSVPSGRPNFRLSRLLAAKLYLQLGEAAHCIDLFQELIVQGMGDPDTALKLLEFQRSARQWAEAEKTMEFLRNRFPGDPGVTGAIAQTFIEHARTLSAGDEARTDLLEQAHKLIEAKEQAEGQQTSNAGFTGIRIQITELRDGVKAAIAETEGLPPALKEDLTIRYLLIDLLKKDGLWENARDNLLELLRETGDEAALYELTKNHSEFQVSQQMLEDAAKDHLEKLPAYSMKCAEIFWRSQNKECQDIARDVQEILPKVLDADWLYLLGMSCRACIPENPLTLEIFRRSLALDPYHEDAGGELIRILKLRPNTQDEIREIARKVRNFHPDAYPDLPA